MPTRVFALLIGAAYLVFGIIGLIPALYTSPPAGAPHMDVTAAYGFLFGLFPVNVVSDIGHILVGIIGLIAGSRAPLARYYSMALFLIFGILTFWGFIPNLDTLWGVVPIYDGDTWLHAATALAGGYFGFVACEPTQVEPVAQPAR